MTSSKDWSWAFFIKVFTNPWEASKAFLKKSFRYIFKIRKRGSTVARETSIDSEDCVRNKILKQKLSFKISICSEIYLEHSISTIKCFSTGQLIEWQFYLEKLVFTQTEYLLYGKMTIFFTIKSTTAILFINCKSLFFFGRTSQKIHFQTDVCIASLLCWMSVECVCVCLCVLGCVCVCVHFALCLYWHEAAICGET